MFHSEIRPVESLENLKTRVDRLLKEKPRRSTASAQLSLDLKNTQAKIKTHANQHTNPAEFLNFISDTLPNSGIYLFGGLLRDLALFGKKGFHSDIDIVFEGDWDSCIGHLENLNAQRNKFGGYRLEISGWPIDIWHAQETWAIREGFVQYKNIASLTKTTILNWDAILMNWRTRKIICQDNYLEKLRERRMEIVLQQNPNPLGATVRILRHLCLKDAKSITEATAEYLANKTEIYTLSQLKNYELLSYGNTAIEEAIYSLFQRLKLFENLETREKFNKAIRSLEKDGAYLSSQQLKLDLYETRRDAEH